MVVGKPLTYTPDCAGCVEKKAAGKRTGLEPLPLKYGDKRKKQPLSTEVFTAKMDRLRKSAAVKRKRSAAALLRKVEKHKS